MKIHEMNEVVDNTQRSLVYDDFSAGSESVLTGYGRGRARYIDSVRDWRGDRSAQLSQGFSVVNSRQHGLNDWPRWRCN